MWDGRTSVQWEPVSNGRDGWNVSGRVGLGQEDLALPRLHRTSHPSSSTASDPPSNDLGLAVQVESLLTQGLHI